ncbi:hypothetical protein F5Y13DRAFT_193697 [Hypoxylon sp. FL1857]|nr:hypothetical protein F5Y13DRAFT_193697 [Hypoxylon sp. FL1857]
MESTIYDGLLASVISSVITASATLAAAFIVARATARLATSHARFPQANILYSYPQGDSAMAPRSFGSIAPELRARLIPFHNDGRP